MEHAGAGDSLDPLDTDQLGALGWAAKFSDRPEVAVAALQRAFAAARVAEPQRAALIAIYIGVSQFGRGADAVGLGWMQQAQNLVADCEECEAHAWLAWMQAVALSEAGEHEPAVVALDATLLRARRLGCIDVEALSSLLKGQILTSQGFVDEGIRLIDPAMALAIGGVLGQFATAQVYCGTISTCAWTGDLERAWQWTIEVGRCGLSGSSGFPGDCRLHRAEILRVRGEWTKAEVELASVCEDLASWHDGHVSIAHYELGEISLRRGDLAAAAQAFAHCREHGYSPLPGMASLELASGRPQVAVALMRAELGTTTQPLDRLRLLPVTVESMLAAGHLDEGRRAADELRSLAGSWPAPLHQARAAHAEGSVALAAGDTATARRQLTAALEWWRKVPAPYDEANSLVVLALAEKSATRAMHLETALESFARLGAVAEVQRVMALLGRHQEADRVTLAMMFTDIEGSTTLLTQLGDTEWLKVLRHHDRILRELFERHGGEILSGTGDGFFVGFPTPDAGLDCALDIQRAPQDVRVRVGVHYAEASRDHGGFSGRGVHEAARISALGCGGDIVVSAATLEHTTKHYPTRDAQTVGLKGLPGEMQIAYLEVAER